ncbi:hypothetical protein [Pseudarcicella hirudinis]|nr:hypothetical protein [Pseudarcicella hirudinis]
MNYETRCGDYDAEIDIDEEQAKIAYVSAKEFIKEVESYLNTYGFL